MKKGWKNTSQTSKQAMFRLTNVLLQWLIRLFSLNCLSFAQMLMHLAAEEGTYPKCHFFASFCSARGKETSSGVALEALWLCTVLVGSHLQDVT